MYQPTLFYYSFSQYITHVNILIQIGEYNIACGQVTYQVHFIKSLKTSLSQLCTFVETACEHWFKLAEYYRNGSYFKIVCIVYMGDIEWGSKQM